jgi:gamma-glutamylcyclotransferase (GGCT)/AIG2-like uncharacterized protein YtfP
VSIDRLFVYGTLKPGQSRWPALAPFVDPLQPAVAAEVEGQLWATPWGWPALTAGTGSVRGVLVTLRHDRVEDALARLDEIEGVDTGLFERVAAQTSDGTVCSIYLWPKGADGFTLLDGEW